MGTIASMADAHMMSKPLATNNRSFTNWVTKVKEYNGITRELTQNETVFLRNRHSQKADPESIYL